MILQSGFKSQIKNLVTLIGVRNFQAASSLSTLENVQFEYRNFIRQLQKRVPGGEPGRTNLATNFAAAKQLRNYFVNNSCLDDKTQGGAITEAADPTANVKERLILRALEEIALYSPEHKTLFDTLITDIFIMPSDVAKAGSTSMAIGVVWANPRVDYALHDVMEILIHELTHHAMFIDEIRHTHYQYAAISNKATWAYSAILRTPRPLDKVLHSIVVATEILLLRQQLIGHPVCPRVHPPSATMYKQLSDAISSVESVLRTSGPHQQILKPRALEILANARKHSSRMPSHLSDV